MSELPPDARAQILPRTTEPGAMLAVWLKLLSAGPIVILFVLIGLSVVSPPFLTPRNISNIVAQTAGGQTIV